jgi:hypothetical protein
MKWHMKWLAAMTSAGLVCLMVGVVSAQQSTTTEMKRFEVISVDGNKVVLRGTEGSKEFTVSEDFRFDVNGQKISVHQLKPGMKGTATITTITTVTPVTVTEIRNGEVLQASGGSVVIKGPNGIKMFNQGDVDKRNITVMKDGKPVDISELRAGDHLSATIVTEKPPKTVTERQVQASIATGTPISTAPAAAPAAKSTTGTTGTSKPAGGTAAAGTAGTSKPATAAAPATGAGATGAAGGTEPGAKKLPKSASSLPLVGVIGLVALTFAAALAVRRRRLAR